MISPEDLEIGKLLGRGATGSVYKGIWQGREVAIKQFNAEIINLKEFYTEVAVMSLMDHETIIPCYGAYAKKPVYQIVMPYYPCGNLTDLLYGNNEEALPDLFLAPSKPNVELTWQSRITIGIRIAEALAYLHGMNIIHRDMKADNLLIDSDLQVCVADLGISCLRAQRNSKAMGTPHYMAPELLEGRQYDEKVDVFSFAILLWEILTGIRPYEEEEFASWELSEKVIAGYRPKIPEEWPEALQKLFNQAWDPEPAKRPAMSIIFESIAPFQGLEMEEIRDIATCLPAPRKLSGTRDVDGTDRTAIFREAAEQARERAEQRLSQKFQPPPPPITSQSAESEPLRKSKRNKRGYSILSRRLVTSKFRTQTDVTKFSL